jgi:uncharacterized protein (TIGR02246 family)
MKHAISAFIIGVAALGTAGAAKATDDAIVQSFEAQQQLAWNNHDAEAYSAAFTQDADIVTPLGWHWTGREEAARNLRDGFKLVYAGSHFQTVDIRVRTLSPDLVLISLTWVISGARTPDGAAPLGEQHGIETQILQRAGNRLLILSQQDTIAPATMPQTSSQQTPTDVVPAPAAFPITPPPVRRCVLARANGECLIYGKPKPAGK